jgi:hypothetical protein
MSEKSEEVRKTSSFGPVAMVAITVILAAVIAAFIFGMSGNLGRNPLELRILDQNDNEIVVKSVHQLSNQPLPNVEIGVYAYGTQNLLEGPIQSNESGLVLLNVPNGYNRFDVIGKYNGTQTIETIDNRPPFSKIEDFFGPTLFAIIIGGIVAYLKRKNLKSIWEKMRKSPNESDDEIDELWRRNY